MSAAEVGEVLSCLDEDEEDADESGLDVPLVDEPYLALVPFTAVPPVPVFPYADDETDLAGERWPYSDT